MKSWLYPGARVVCVEAADDLVVGKVYTVKNVGRGLSGAVMIDVEELDHWVVEGWVPTFYASRFRPLTKRSTDAQVSKLKRLLNTTPADLEREGV